MDLNARADVNCGQKDGRTDGRTDRRTDGLTDGRTDRQTEIRTPISHLAKAGATKTNLSQLLLQKQQLFR